MPTIVRTRISGMSVTVVDVRVVRMDMCDRLVHVRMGMRLAAIPGKVVRVLVVFVVAVAVLVGERFMRVLVCMAFADVQPDAHRHQCAGQPEGKARMLGE